MLKTPIAYYGGKLSIIHHILPLIPEHVVYTEAFMGGGTVFFAKKPAPNETINDQLDIVINFYKILKTNYPALKCLIDQSLVSRTMHHRAMRLLRSKRAPKVERAWAFWFCSNFSYANNIGGGLKYSNDMSVLAPRILKNKKAAFTDLLVSRIENVTIENNDALKVLRTRDHITAFHYVDPPYPGADQGHYRGYGWEEFELLLQQLTRMKGRFLLSNYPSEMLDLYSSSNGWNTKHIVHRLKAPRKSNPVKHEVLVSNYPLNSQCIIDFENT